MQNKYFFNGRQTRETETRKAWYTYQAILNIVTFKTQFIVFVILAYYKSACLGLWRAEALECGQFKGEFQANTEMLNMFRQSINRPCELQGHLQWKHCLVTTDWNVHIGDAGIFPPWLWSCEMSCHAWLSILVLPVRVMLFYFCLSVSQTLLSCS